MKAILIVSHGSRSPKTKEEILLLVSALGQRFKGVMIHYAFLEIESPSIQEGISQCVSKGARVIIIALNFLNAGRHVDVDIPEIIQEAKKEFSHVDIKISKPIGQHQQIPDLFVELINNA